MPRVSLEMSSPESILITGGAGFVGSSLAFHLKKCFLRTRVVCLDNLYRHGSELNRPRLQAAAIEFVRGDIRRADEFPPGPFEFILEGSEKIARCPADLRIFLAGSLELFSWINGRLQCGVEKIAAAVFEWRRANESKFCPPV
jgi:hypothetical protein